MEYRPLDITIISAENLKNVNLLSKMSVYVAVSVSGDPRTLRRTPIHHDAGKSPRWNHRVSLPVSDNLRVVFKIYSDRILGDKEIGEVSVPVKELLDASGNGGNGGERVVEYQVRTVSGKTKGTLKFSFKFGDKIAHAPPPVAAAPPHYGAALPPYAEPTSYAKPPPYDGAPPPYAQPPQHSSAPPPYAPEGKFSGEPVTAYPPQHGAGYPAQPYAQPYAPPPQMGYGYPPQQGYGYPPPQQGYGYPPPQQGYGYGAVPPKKKKQGMGGLGLGLGAGLLGGLLVGDMISDVGDYDAGGFDDGGGFDF